MQLKEEMVPTKGENLQARQATILACALLAVTLLLLVPEFYRWTQGRAPIYPGQYESRFLEAASLGGLLAALLLTLSHRYHTSGGRLAYWLLLAVAACALVAHAVI